MLSGLETGVARICDGVGERGSSGDAERVVLRDGSSVVIRLLASDDEAAIASWFTGWFAGLRPETLYARLFVLLQRLAPYTESALARGDRSDHEVIMAFAPDGVAVGIARCMRVGKLGSAEVTVAVADDWRGRGIASMLLERVVTRARSVGIERLTAICVASNLTLIRLLSRLGAMTVGPSAAGLVDIRVDLI
jgi:RimJ/RimL family protein N-acetyltransferase